MKGLLLLALLVVTAALAADADKSVLAGARIDRVSKDFAALTGGAVNLQKDDLNLVVDPIVGYPPMLLATLEANDSPGNPFDRGTPIEVRGNFYAQGAKDKVPNTVFHSAVTYGDYIFTYGGLVQDQLLPLVNSAIDTTFQYFDTNNFQWVDLSDEVPAGGPQLWGHCAVLVGSQMVLLGGRSTGTTLNSQMWWIDLDNITAGWQSYNDFSPSPQFYDATCFTYNDGTDDLFVVIGGRNNSGVSSAITTWSITDAFNGAVVSNPTFSDCGLAVPRFGADGDFFQNDPLIASSVFFVVVGGFTDLQYHPIAVDNDEHVLVYDFFNDECATSFLPLPPKPAFPEPQPLHRYVFSEVEYASKIRVETLTNDVIIYDWADATVNGQITGASVADLNNGVFEVDGEIVIDSAYGRSTRSVIIRGMDDWADSDTQANVISFEMFFSTNNELNEYRNEYFPDPIDGLAPKTIRLMDYGYTFTEAAGTLGPYTLGLYMDDQKRLVSYITGSKSVDVWGHADVFEALDLMQYEKPFTTNHLRGYSAGRTYASAVRSTATISTDVTRDFHVACNWNLIDRTMNIILDGQVVAEGPMFANFKLSPSGFAKFGAIGRSLNQNAPINSPRSRAERPFQGNITEVRFYHGEVDAQRCQEMISLGPDMGPRARGYHNVFAYENNIMFTGGFGVDPESNDQYYLRPYTDLWSISCPATNTPVAYEDAGSENFNSNSVSSIAQWLAISPWEEPALETEEIEQFIATKSWNFPMNRPFGTAIDLPAFRASTFTIPGQNKNEDF